MTNEYYRIIKYIKDIDGSLLSDGYLPGKFISIEQANLKIKTLDSNYQYIVEPEFTKDMFYKRPSFYQIRYFNPIQHVTVDTTISKQTTELWIAGEHMDTFDTLEECKTALVTLGIPLHGLN